MSDLPPSRRDEREAKLALCNAALMKGDPAYAANLVPWLIAEVRSLSQQLDDAKRDAERYREIRSAFVDVKWGDMPLFRPATLPHAKYVKPDDFDALADSYIADAKLDPFVPASPRA